MKGRVAGKKQKEAEAQKGEGLDGCLRLGDSGGIEDDLANTFVQ